MNVTMEPPRYATNPACPAQVPQQLGCRSIAQDIKLGNKPPHAKKIKQLGNTIV